MYKKLMSLAALVAAVACGDAGPSGPRTADAGPDVIAPSAILELAGIVEVSGSDLAPVYLRAGEERYALLGSEAWALIDLAGAEVRTRGTMDGFRTMFVRDFLVLAVKGRVVVDGVLDLTDDGLSIRLQDGTMYQVTEAPENLMQHVGQRIWFAPKDNDAAAAFGVILQ